MKLILYTLLFISILSSCSTKEEKMQSIEDWTKLHAKDIDFIEQARSLIDSVAQYSPTELENYTRQITDALCLAGHTNQAVSIAAYIHGIDIAADEESLIGQRLLTQLQLKGHAAPPLPVEYDDRLMVIYNGSIVLFYESDCNNCHDLIDELKLAHDSLSKAGIKIVSIASDVNPDIYNSTSSQFPWKDKYCDYRSFVGDYFKLWGVASTSTMYFVNYRGIVKGRYHNLDSLVCDNRQ